MSFFVVTATYNKKYYENVLFLNVKLLYLINHLYNMCTATTKLNYSELKSNVIF